MKKIFGIALLSILILLITACGGNSKSESAVIEEKLIEIPDVTNTMLNDAEKSLKDAGFTNITSEYDKGEISDTARMIVVEQNYTAGEQVNADSEIVLKCKKVCTVSFEITSEGNWIFSKYDIVIRLDDKEID